MHPGLSLDRPRRTSGCSSDCRACAPPSRGSLVSGRVSMPGGSETAWRRHRKIARLSVLSMAHHTKDKGDLGVAKAHADLVSQGFVVLFPATEHAPIWSRTSTAVSRDCRSRTEQVARAQQRCRFGLFGPISTAFTFNLPTRAPLTSSASTAPRATRALRQSSEARIVGHAQAHPNQQRPEVWGSGGQHLPPTRLKLPLMWPRAAHPSLQPDARPSA